MCKSILPPRQGALKPLYHSLSSSFFFLFPLFFLSFSFLPLPTGIPTPLPSSKPSTSPTRTSTATTSASTTLLQTRTSPSSRLPSSTDFLYKRKQQLSTSPTIKQSSQPYSAPALLQHTALLQHQPYPLDYQHTARQSSSIFN